MFIATLATWLLYLKFLNTNNLCIRPPCQSLDGLFYSIAGKKHEWKIDFQSITFWRKHFATLASLTFLFFFLLFISTQLDFEWNFEPLLQEVAADYFTHLSFCWIEGLFCFSHARSLALWMARFVGWTIGWSITSATMGFGLKKTNASLMTHQPQLYLAH